MYFLCGTMLKQFINLQHLLKTFPDEQTCIDYLYHLRPECPRCNHPKVWRFKNGSRFKCAGCKRQFTMKTGTIFENSNITLQQWFILIYLHTKFKKGVNSYLAADEADITQKTSWYRLQAIREILAQNQPKQMAGVVEADGTWVGGKNKNRHMNKRVRKNTDKTVVFGMLSRSSGQVKTQIVKSEEATETHPIILATLHKNWTIITDDNGGYNGLNQWYNHVQLNRSAYQYVGPLKEGSLQSSHTNKQAHTNGIEGFWPWIDRAVMGTYHKISPKYLQLYLNECTFRYNTRKLSQDDRMKLALSYRHEKTSYKKIKAKQKPKAEPKFYFRPNKRN